MENKKNFIINVFYYLLILGFIYLFYKYLLGIFSPFIIAFIFAYIALVICKKIFKKDTKLLRTISILIVYLAISLLIVLLVAIGFNELSDFFSSIPDLYRKFISPLISDLEKYFINLNNTLPVDIRTVLNSAIDGLFGSLTSLVGTLSLWLVNITKNAISYTPTLLIKIITTIIASFFFLYDFETIVDYINDKIPTKAKNIYEDVKKFVFNNLLVVLKSYVAIMGITFVELFIGFMLLGVKDYALIALLTSFVDILPILGVGTILIPWGIIDLVAGNIFMGLMILLLYLIITIIRNIIEPKLVGSNLGLHPLVALISMIVGLDLAGVLGLIGAPIIISFFVYKEK